MSEETRAEASRIVEKYTGEPITFAALTNAIDKALQARDERAARIADKEAQEWEEVALEMPKGDPLCEQAKTAARAAKNITAAIRSGADVSQGGHG